MQSSTPLIIYHRGRHGTDIRIKENTLRAFERAIKEGAHMIEFDVQSDLRVTHDPNPNATAPTLPEVMAFIHGRCAVNIEMKSPQVTTEVAEIINEALTIGCWMPNQIVVSSFHHETAVVMKRRFPQLRVGVINDGVLERVYVHWLAQQGINNLHLAWANIYMDVENSYALRAAARENNMQIWVWTVNTKEIFDTVVAYGAEAVFTDKPQLFR